MLLNNLVHQLALLPGLVSAVLVAGKHLLSIGSDLPLGVTHLLGDVFAFRHLLDLYQGLESVWNTFLGCEGVCLGLVTPDGLLPLLGVAGVAGLHGALGAGQVDADLLCLGLTAPLHPVAADLLCGGVVLNLTVIRDIHTLILRMVMVVVVEESHALGDKSKEEDLGQHVVCWEDSVGILSANFTPPYIHTSPPQVTQADRADRR